MQIAVLALVNVDATQIIGIALVPVQTLALVLHALRVAAAAALASGDAVTKLSPLGYCKIIGTGLVIADVVAGRCAGARMIAVVVVQEFKDPHDLSGFECILVSEPTPISSVTECGAGQEEIP